MNKSKLYYVMTSLTLFLPTIIYLILIAILADIHSDYYIKTAILGDVVIGDIGKTDEWFVYSIDREATYHGVVHYNHNYYRPGFYITDEDFIRINNKFYEIQIIDGNREFVDITFKIKERGTGYKIPFIVLIGGLGFLIGTSYISKKLEWYKKNKPLAALLGLSILTLVFWLIDMIVGGLLGVFTIFTISFAVYFMEYTIYNLKNRSDVRQEKVDELEKELETIRKKLGL